MKKILLTLLIIFSLNFISRAQLSKGSVLLGGDLSWYSNKTTVTGVQDTKGNSGSFIVSIGKAIKDNNFVGVNFIYSHTDGGYTMNEYGVALFYRIYKDLGKNFFLFGEAGVEYNGSKQTDSYPFYPQETTMTTNTASIYLMPGLSYKISKKFLLELSLPNLFNLNYYSSKATTKGTPDQVSTLDSFSANASLTSNPLTNLTIGFRLLL
jgi:hypothetical protein